MLDAKARGEYVDEQELKRQAKSDQKKKGGRADDDECLEWEFEPDPELRKIGEEGRKVGWAYRYRIRRKLEHLQQRQAGKMSIVRRLDTEFRAFRNRCSVRLGNARRGWQTREEEFDSCDLFDDGGDGRRRRRKGGREPEENCRLAVPLPRVEDARS